MLKHNRMPDLTGVDHGNATMYSYGCRCDECKAAKLITCKIQNAVKRRAAAEFKRLRHNEYDRFIDEAYEEFGLIRNPVGSPPRPGNWSTA